jgi:transposase-like protein
MSQVSHLCHCLDDQVEAFQSRSLDQAHFPDVYRNATYLHSRRGPYLQVVTQSVVVAIPLIPWKHEKSG